MNAEFKLFNISKRYGQREVLNIDNLEIGGGRIYCILGPNGAGKTTLFRIMSLLTLNDTGKIHVLGEEVTWQKNQVVRLRRKMAMVTQTSFMFEGSVYYNVAYGLRVRNTPAAEERKTVNESLELLGMMDFINQPARNLSGGERQKVAIARALAVKPRVLFLDEPTSNIDPASALDIERYIQYINKEMGTTIIMVTHNLFQARRLSEEIFFMWEGKIIEKGESEELFEHAQDKRTRSFIKGEIVF
jgi:tungstate transport system ATP-binding protein